MKNITMSLFGVTHEYLRESYNMIRETIDDPDLKTMKFMIYIFTTLYIVMGGGYYINLLTRAIAPEFENVWYGKIILFSIGSEYGFFINKKVFRLLYLNDWFLDDVTSVMVMTIKGLSEIVCDTCYEIQFYYYKKRNDDLYRQMKQYTKNKELSTRNHHGFDGIIDVDD
jgi:hypothetical protein